MSSSKKYGLILPDKSKSQQPKFQAARNVFGKESDSEDESNKKPVLLRPSHNINRQAKLTQEKAIIEDPTVYQYDEIYDKMARKKNEKKVKSKEDKKPQYIEKLMKAANKRKIENERRIERQIQKEREKEGDEFADKEVFVTSAYKKKLEEMSLEELKEKREEYLESIGDVTKQRDLGGFYRHLYEQKLGEDKVDDQQSNTEKGSEKNNPIDKPETSKRNYRKRKSSSDIKKHLSDGEIEDSDDEINRVNLQDIRLSKRSKHDEENIDADSDFSIDGSSGDEGIDSKTEDHKPLTSTGTPTKPDTQAVVKESAPKAVLDDENSKKDEKIKQEEVPVKAETKPKIDLWKKRTVGEVFEHALKRYYERKAARGI